MSKCWLLRENYEWQVAYSLLEAGYLSVGFSDVADENTLKLLLSEDVNFDRVFDALLGGYGNNREYLNIFLKQMSNGDCVCVPTKDGLKVYEISGEAISKESLDLRELEKVEALKSNLTRNSEGYLECNGNIVDLGFFRKIVYKGFIDKGNLTGNITDAICNQRTITKIKGKVDTTIIQQRQQQTDEAVNGIKGDLSSNSRIDKVKQFLTWLSANDAVQREKNGTDLVVNIKDSGHEIYVCVQPETDSQNVKDWLTDKIDGYKKSKSIERDSAMLWLIANDNYFPESIKRDAGIGLKVDSYKDFEELYLNALQTNYLMKKSVVNLYGRRLESIKEKANKLLDDLQSENRMAVSGFNNLIKSTIKNKDNDKDKDKDKHILIYPLVFEFQNYKYVRINLENYVKYNSDIDYACIVADGFICLFSKQESSLGYVYLSEKEVGDVITGNVKLEDIDENHKKDNRCIILRSIGYSGDTDPKDMCKDELWKYIFDSGKENLKKLTVCKYGSLQGLYDTLNTQNFRLMGLACQNDTTEVDYVESYGGKSKGIPEDANSFFILSMLSKEDDLTMWRLYGEEAKGVCLVFEIEKFDGCNYTCRPIDYAEHRGYHKKLNIIRQLKNNGLEFSLFNKWRHFFKPYDYRIEQEIRFLFCNMCFCKEGKCKDVNWVKCNSNAIFTPSVDIKVDSCPLKLKKIILGPKCPEKEINRQQIANMIKDKNLFNGRDIEVTTSSIDNYR